MWSPAAPVKVYTSLEPGASMLPAPAPGTPGDTVAFTTLQSRLFFPLGQLLNVQVEVQGAMALFDRIFEYLDLEPSIVDEPGARELSRSEVRGAIRFRDVHFAYADTVTSVLSISCPHAPRASTTESPS